MKNIIATTLATIVLGSSAFAYNPNTPVTVSSAPALKLVPTKVVTPASLPRTFGRGVVTVEFSLDANGQPQNIEIVSQTERSVKESVVKAFKQWKFDPTAANGAKRYVLPLEVVVPGA